MTKQLHLRAGLFLLFLGFSACPIFGQDPDIQNDRWDQIFRTSDLEGETPTASRRYHGFTKRVSVPAGAVRLGCLCMDDTPSEVRSTGACSGHGGVRYWIYRTMEGDSLRVSTWRNETHPAPLDTAEMSAMSRKKVEKSAANRVAEAIQAMPITIVMPPMASAAPGQPTGFFNWDKLWISVMVLLGLTGLRLLLDFLKPFRDELADALHHKLRHRR